MDCKELAMSKMSIFFLLVTLFASPFASAKQNTSSNKLICIEEDASNTDEGFGAEHANVAVIQVDFFPNGQVREISVERQEVGGTPPISRTFDTFNSQIQHGMIRVGGKEFESFQVTVEEKTVFQLNVNDRFANGYPGSSIVYPDGEDWIKTSDLGNWVSCNGRVLHPVN